MYQVVIVDDEVTISEGIANLFPWKEIGFEAHAFSEPDKALQYINQNQVDVLMSDIEMPEMNGLELTKEIAKGDIKVVIISSHQNYEYFRKAIQYHAVDYLLKPIGYEDLVACFGKIREELDREYGVEQESSRASQSHYDRMVEQVTAYIHENYRDASLEKAAVLVGLSPSHLSRTFKEKSGTGFAELLVQVRMEKASEMLSDVRCKSYEVAYEVGYDNPKNFSRAFKTYYGKSPSEYRKEKMGGLEA